MYKRRTKILATIGPSSDSPEMLEALFRSGVNACRLNFSHGTHKDHAQRIKRIRDVSKTLNQPIAIVLDLGGPKVRTDLHTYHVEVGEIWNLSGGEGDPANKLMGIAHPSLHTRLAPGNKILFDDGKVDMLVLATHDTHVECQVITGGTLTPRKSVNTPGVDNGLEILSPKDRMDLNFGMDHSVDWVAVSFVRHGQDMESVREYLAEIGWNVPLIAKIETPLAVAHLEEIVKVSDGIMVARGDLGIECPIEDVPILQKQAVNLARQYSKLSIVATQMLESMTHAPRPTRAEASDVANAVFEGAQVVMLSGETANGDYPLQVVATMDRILRQAEQLVETPKKAPLIVNQTQEIVSGSIRLHEHTNSPVIIIFCNSEQVACIAASFNSRAYIVAACWDENVLKRVTLFYGITPVRIPPIKSIDSSIARLLEEVRQRNLATEKDRAIFVYAQPTGRTLHNTIRLVRMSESDPSGAV